MARLDALPSIDIIRSFNRILDFYLWRGLPCVRAWPRYRPANQTPASKASAHLFGDIIKGYNLLGEGPLTAFRLAAADQQRSSRDIYVSAVLGHLHDRTPPPPPPVPEVLMHTQQWLDPERVTYSGSAFPWRGNYVRPMKDILLHAIAGKGDWPQAITLQFGLFTVAAGVIASIVYKSPGTTLPLVFPVNPSQTVLWERLHPPWALLADTTYLLMMGRTDGPDNYVLPISTTVDFHPPPFSAYELAVSHGRFTKAVPLVGDAVDSRVGASHFILTWEYA